MNTQETMNTRPSRGAGLERALLEALRRTLAAVSWLPEPRAVDPNRRASDQADATVVLKLAAGRKAALRLYVKAEMRSGIFPSWAVQRRPEASKDVATVPVLMMPNVQPRLADLCRQEGWSWHDLAGNCWLDVPGLLHIERSGIPPVRRAPRPSANLSTAAAGRVLRALLSPAHAGRVWTQRSLLPETAWDRVPGDQPVSLGLVNKVVRYLRDEGFVEDVGPPKRIRYQDTEHRRLDDGAAGDGAGRGVRVRDPSALLDAWKNAYRFDRHERRSFFTLLKGAELRDALYRVGLDAGGMAAYAAFSAAERQAPHVRQPKVWMYLGAAFVDSLVQRAQAKEVDSGENLVVLVPDDSGVFITFDANRHVDEHELDCTDPVQTYVDLAHCGGRGEEAAQAVLEQRILPAWKTAVRE